ncbi:MAG TPA: hypothetical protein VFD45_02230 [Patescibacteria group bacterium]|nr:hypothetical protein [Patescibacteria group bacterium]
MKKEKTVLALLAIVIGLVFAGIAFYFYQYTKILPQFKANPILVKAPSPTPESTIFLSINNPSDEKLSDKKIVTVSGKTNPDAIIAIFTKSDFDILKPSLAGDFSTTVNISDGVNIIRITAIAPNGEEKTIERTVSFTTEEF